MPGIEIGGTAGNVGRTLFDPGNLLGTAPVNDGSDAARLINAAIQRAIAEQRRQFNITQENINPFIEAGQGALSGVVDATTAEGLDANLASIFDTDIFGSLVDERTRAVEGQLAAGGLTRSGTAIEEIADIPTSLGLQLEGLLSGRLENLAGTGLNAAQGLGAIGQSNSANIAQGIIQQGQASASGILTDAQTRAAQQQQLLQAGATAAAVFFSDPALKENVEPVSKIRDLTLYQWDWIPETKGTMIEKCSTIGFMADEVKDQYPQHVAEHGGFMVINYPALLDELEAK